MALDMNNHMMGDMSQIDWTGLDTRHIDSYTDSYPDSDIDLAFHRRYSYSYMDCQAYSDNPDLEEYRCKRVINFW